MRASPLSIGAWVADKDVPGRPSAGLAWAIWGQCMCKAMVKVRIRLVGASPPLEAEARDVDHPAIVFTPADPARAAASQVAAMDCDVVVVNLDQIGALGVPGRSLEHLLLLAELRRAAIGIPGPVDAVELALTAFGVLPVPGLEKVASDPERRVTW